jgi:hypothetical protein
MNNEELIAKIKSITNISDISDIFLYGSRAYNTFNNNSDYDFIVISPSVVDNGRQYNQSNINITVYSKQHFQDKLNENKPFAIECFYLPESFKLINNSKFKLKLNNFEKEYSLKIEEDEKKLLKQIKLSDIVRSKFFIGKLKIQLNHLLKNEDFDFNLKDLLISVRQETYINP